MCFSAEASFAVGAAPLPASAYCLWSAACKKPRYWVCAAVPLIFGLQQLAEGFVWQGFERQDGEQVRTGSLLFLFFALGVVPFWFPFLSAVIDTRPRWRRLFGGITVWATVWFWLLYLPLLTGPASLLTTELVHHSLQYHYPDLWVHQYVPTQVQRLLYFATLAIPMGLCSETWSRIPTLVLTVGALVAMLLFDYAFVSVWCFFAALLAAYMCYVFYQLPEPSA